MKEKKKEIIKKEGRREVAKMKQDMMEQDAVNNMLRELEKQQNDMKKKETKHYEIEQQRLQELK